MCNFHIFNEAVWTICDSNALLTIRELNERPDYVAAVEAKIRHENACGDCHAEEEAQARGELWAEQAIERYYEGGWDQTGSYAEESFRGMDFASAGGWAQYGEDERERPMRGF